MVTRDRVDRPERDGLHRGLLSEAGQRTPDRDTSGVPSRRARLHFDRFAAAYADGDGLDVPVSVNLAAGTVPRV